MKLLSEQLTENSNFELIEESDEKGNKSLYISGVFAQANIKNRNGRVYPKEILAAAIEKYNNDFVSQGRALGEMNHPSSPAVNPKEACIKIESLIWNGDNVLGKAKVLSVANGPLLAGLIKEGVKLGVSTRGLGTTKKTKFQNETVDMVEGDYDIRAIDVVSAPSGIDCFVNGILESEDYEIVNGKIMLTTASNTSEATQNEERSKTDKTICEDEKKAPEGPIDAQNLINDIINIFKQ